MAKILDDIIKKTREDLEKRKKDYPLEWLGRSLSFNPFVPKDVQSALRSTEENPYRIIAEVKKASPSKGVIREDFDPVLIAQQYTQGGADALSILTEPHFFQGDKEYLGMIRRYVNVPLLRKDFIIDKYQLVEALAYGADFVLLIAKALSRKELKELYAKLENAKTTPLVTGHPKCPDLWIVEGVDLGSISGDDIVENDRQSINFKGYEYQKTETGRLIKSKEGDEVCFDEIIVDGYLTKEEIDKYEYEYMSTPWYSRYSGKTSPFWLSVFYGNEGIGSPCYVVREDGFVVRTNTFLPDINIVDGYIIITDNVRIDTKLVAKLIIIDKNDKISTHTLGYDIITIENIKVENNIITILADGRETILEVD